MPYTKHETAIIDEGAQIGEGSRIWHWVHICSGAKIGNNCSFGQNVYVSNKVTIGNNCKIQNNVSVYDNVTLEDMGESESDTKNLSIATSEDCSPVDLILQRNLQLRSRMRQSRTSGSVGSRHG